MKNKTKNAYKIFLSVILVVIVFFGGFITSKLLYGNKMNTISWAVNMIDRFYYSEENGEVVEFSSDDYVKSFTSLLDDYSTFYNEEEYNDVIRTDKGNNFGTGISFLKSDLSAKIYDVTYNSPADKAGLQRGDILLGAKKGNENRVDFNYANGYYDYRNFLLSINQNEEFTLYYKRDEQEKSAILSKKVFTTSYVRYYDNTNVGNFYGDGSELNFTLALSDKMNGLDNDTFYIKFTQFEGDAYTQLKGALSYARNANKSKLIFDLRDNGGGQMTVLSKIASLFIDLDDAVICYAHYKDGIVYPFKTGKSEFNDYFTKITVLANEGSASASECLIGAMLFYNNRFSIDNLIIEKSNQSDENAKTFGKGIMQTTYYNNLLNCAIKLTTAYIYQPDNTTCIHNRGIVVSGDNAVYNNAIGRAIEILS